MPGRKGIYGQVKGLHYGKIPVAPIRLLYLFPNRIKVKPNAAQAAEEELHKMLPARYRAYRKSGLTGISPYDREKGKKTDPGKDLRLNSDAPRILKQYVISTKLWSTTLRQALLVWRSSFRGYSYITRN